MTLRFAQRLLTPVAWLGVLVLIGGLQRADPPTAPVIVASVDVTGLLTPIATFDGTAWKNDWPQMGEAPEVHGERESAARSSTPMAWTSGVPLPKVWNLWEWGGSARLVRARELARPIETQCGEVWGMRTDFSPRPSTATLTPNSCPIPIAGAALSDGRPLLEMPAFETRSVPMAALSRSFEEVETQTINRLALDPGMFRPNTNRTHLYDGHPIALTARQGHPIKVRRANRVVVDRTSLIYVEARREYKRPETFNDPGCNAVSLLRTWLHVDSLGRVTPITPEITLTDCDGKEAEGFEPLGVLLMGGVPHVIVEIGGWESQEVGIVRVTAADAKLLVRGRTR